MALTNDPVPSSKPDNALAALTTLTIGMFGTFVWFMVRIADIGWATTPEGLAAWWVSAACTAFMLTRDGD
jgi:hypothetical protein